MLFRGVAAASFEFTGSGFMAPGLESRALALEFTIRGAGLLSDEGSLLLKRGDKGIC